MRMGLRPRRKPCRSPLRSGRNRNAGGAAFRPPTLPSEFACEVKKSRTPMTVQYTNFVRLSHAQNSPIIETRG